VDRERLLNSCSLLPACSASFCCGLGVECLHRLKRGCSFNLSAVRTVRAPRRCRSTGRQRRSPPAGRRSAGKCRCAPTACMAPCLRRCPGLLRKILVWTATCWRWGDRLANASDTHTKSASANIRHSAQGRRDLSPSSHAGSAYSCRHTFVPVEPEPFEVRQHLLFRLLRRPRQVGVLDPAQGMQVKTLVREPLESLSAIIQGPATEQGGGAVAHGGRTVAAPEDQLAVVSPREEVVEERGACAADVQVASRRRREAHTDLFGEALRRQGDAREVEAQTPGARPGRVLGWERWDSGTEVGRGH